MKNRAQQLQNAIDSVDRDYFYGMRSLADRIDRDEQTARLSAQHARVRRIDRSRQEAINARRQELRK